MKNFIFGLLGGMDVSLFMPYNLLRSEYMKSKYKEEETKLPNYVTNLKIARIGVFIHYLFLTFSYIFLVLLTETKIEASHTLLKIIIFTVIFLGVTSISDIIFYLSKKCKLL